MRHRHCHPHCGCGRPKNPIVHPVKENVVHHCTEETVQHVHPSHTTVKNHHIIKNEHVYPHSTSTENSCEYVDINNGPNNMTAGPGNEVAGAMYPGMYPGMHPGMKHHKKHKHPGMGHHKKHNKWC